MGDSYEKTEQDLREQLQASQQEVGQMREKNRSLHRRCQEAESAFADYRKVIALPPDGDGIRFVQGSFGRALLAGLCNKLDAELQACERDAATNVELLRRCLRWMEAAEIQHEGEWGNGSSLAALEAAGSLSPEILDVRAAIAAQGQA